MTSKYIRSKSLPRRCPHSSHPEPNILSIDVLNDDNFVFTFECDCSIIAMYMYAPKWATEGIKKDISANRPTNF